MDQSWRIEMLGWLRVVQPDRVVSRFRTRKAGALLAYLAYHRQRSHPREQLIDLLWPRCGVAAGQRNLRTELASLRRQLEPPGVPVGAVLLADRTAIQLNGGACDTDVALFEAALAAADRAGEPGERVERLIEAAERYRGELLPGAAEEWVLAERQRLAEAHLQALQTLVGLLETGGDPPRALQWARRAVAVDPLHEESHERLIRLLIAAGQFDAAWRQCERLERLLGHGLGATLSAETRALMASLPPPSDLPAASAARERRKHRRVQLPASSPPAGLGAGSTEAGREATAEAKTAPPTDNLLLRLNRFFGREREMEQLQALLQGPETRLVTLTGPGGTGKTRLAQSSSAVHCGLASEAASGSFRSWTSGTPL